MKTSELLSRYAAGQRDFRDLNLIAAKLKNANLSYANLSGADLRGANLTRANLSGADLRGANLTETNLSDVNLSHTSLHGAIMPDGTIYSYVG